MFTGPIFTHNPLRISAIPVNNTCGHCLPYCLRLRESYWFADSYSRNNKKSYIFTKIFFSFKYFLYFRFNKQTNKQRKI